MGAAIVASVKLMAIAPLKFGGGLYAFIALIIITTLLTGSLDSELFWQRIAQLPMPTKANALKQGFIRRHDCGYLAKTVDRHSAAGLA